MVLPRCVALWLIDTKRLISTMMATQILCSQMKGSYLSACGLALIWMHAHSCSNPCRAYGTEEQGNLSKPDCFASSAGLLQLERRVIARARGQLSASTQRDALPSEGFVRHASGGTPDCAHVARALHVPDTGTASV